MAKVKRRIKQGAVASPFKNYWDKNNYIIFFVGFAVLLLGNVLMSQGPWDNPVSLTVAPLVMLIAYLVIFPVAILYSRKKETNEAAEE